jgi:hypothetical protein
MDPITTINAAILALDAILNIINQIRGQSGLTDDQILAAAASQATTNTDQIKKLLAGLPPKSV